MKCCKNSLLTGSPRNILNQSNAHFTLIEIPTSSGKWQIMELELRIIQAPPAVHHLRKLKYICITGGGGTMRKKSATPEKESAVSPCGKPPFN